jgi:zinc/manganese transport system substrate-binding protein
MKNIFNWITLVLAVALAACGQPATGTPAVTRPRVVATFSILGDLVGQVGGDLVEPHTLVGPDGDAHTFEPAPADAVSVAQADLDFENGLEFEAWLDQLYTSSGSTAQRVVVTEGVTPGQIGLGDEAGSVDPHTWQDVTSSMKMVEIIRDALAMQDPAHAAAYQANAASYLAQLQTLDTEIQGMVNTLAPERRRLVTNHDALGYFARRYGFEILGNALGSISTEAGEPSAAQLAQLIEEIKAAGVPAIFTENIENNSIINQVAQEAGVVVAPPLYTDALGMPGTDGETYLKMMRYNAETIVAALK